ncbi:hypothetical protein AQUCO_03100011v1 [Aquilegia coerulea]|uniref:Uncharacterized protein n=1 Tax=Aquilegia coerulea TaxID=218851 RepID=A0A2G5D0C2_AQUCA|nr:hypothetical protein AQUCO_03100011v1 [Aquilegia coerulea]
MKELQETTKSEIESISNLPLDVDIKANSFLCEQIHVVSSQQVFETRLDLIQWAQKIGLTCGIVVVVFKSENASSDGTRRLYLACERSGMYRDHRKKEKNDNREKVDEKEKKGKNKLRRTGTKKNNCPFRLKGVFVRGSEDKWKVEVLCARHNYGLAISFERHSYVGRLRPEQEKLVFDLMKTWVEPKYVLYIIKDSDLNNSSTIRHIYNAKQKQRKLEKADKTELRCLQGLLGENISVDVIVTDRDRALMNAADVIFPTVVKFLCRWHISRDVLAKGKRLIRDWNTSNDVLTTEKKDKQDKDMAETLCDKWANVVLATTEAEYIHQLGELENEFKRWPKFIHYLHQTWLGYERFIAAWTDQHMHFGNTSTNRVECAHASLKRALKSSKYDFLGMWEMIHPSLTVQITEITASFVGGLLYVKHEHNILCFQNIRGIVSLNALDLIVEEMKRCGYGDKIHLDEINEFWKKLSITVVDVDLSDLEVRPEFLALINRYKNSTTDQKTFMLKQMFKLGKPQCSGLLQPLEYNKMFGGEEQVNTLLDILDAFDSPCPRKNWFFLPYMGYLVASRYHHMLVYISPKACLTFVPLRIAPPSKKQKVLAISHINDNHFVPLKLKYRCPIPEPVPFWKKFHHRDADKWENLLKHRNRAFKEIGDNKGQTQEGSYDQPIVLE